MVARCGCEPGLVPCCENRGGGLRMVMDILSHTLHFDVQFGSAEAAAQHKLYFFMRQRVKGT